MEEFETLFRQYRDLIRRWHISEECRSFREAGAYLNLSEAIWSQLQERYPALLAERIERRRDDNGLSAVRPYSAPTAGRGITGRY